MTLEGLIRTSLAKNATARSVNDHAVRIEINGPADQDFAYCVEALCRALASACVDWPSDKQTEYEEWCRVEFSKRMAILIAAAHVGPDSAVMESKQRR